MAIVTVDVKLVVDFTADKNPTQKQIKFAAEGSMA